MAPTENTPGKNEASTAATTPAPTDTLTVAAACALRGNV
jgi:hypothetical protein